MPTLSLDLKGLLRSIFAGRALPALRPLGWVPVASVEDGSEGFPETERLTAERLGMIAANFNPDLYSPPVVWAPPGSTGNGHEAAERHPPLGKVIGQIFDGSTLWERWAEYVDLGAGAGRIEQRLAEGHNKRSLGFWPGTHPSVPGGWTARHTLITSEPEGQVGLPSLDLCMPAMEGRLAALPFASRLFADDNPVEEPAMPPTPEDPNAIADAVAGRVQTMITEALAAERTARAAESAAFTGRLDTLATELTAERTARAAEQAATLRSEISGRLQALQGEGRLPEGEVESELASLLALPVEGRASRLALIAGRAPMIPLAARLVTVGEEQVPLDSDLLDLEPSTAGRLMQFRRKLAELPEADRVGPKGAALYQQLVG